MPKQKLSMKTFLFVFLSVFLFFLAPVSVKAFPGICWSSETFVNQGAENLFDGSYRIEWIQRTFLEDIFAVRQHACRYLPCPSHSAELS